MLNRDELLRRLTLAAARPAEGFSDDGDLPHPRPERELTPAAVLIAVLARSEPTVLFTQRTAHLNAHAGQISFPGGRTDAEDRDAIHTALREAEEETGLAPERVEILGRIADYTTGTGFRVTPVVGWVQTPPALSEYSHDPFEVAEVFEVPLRFLLDPRNHRRETALFKGRLRSYHAMPYEGRYIWGATAGMLLTFYRTLVGVDGAPLADPVAAPLDSG